MLFFLQHLLNLKLFLNQRSSPEGPSSPQGNKALEACPHPARERFLGGAAFLASLWDVGSGVLSSLDMRQWFILTVPLVLRSILCFFSSWGKCQLKKILFLVFFCRGAVGLDKETLVDHVLPNILCHGYLESASFRPSTCEYHQNSNSEFFRPHSILKPLNFFPLLSLVTTVSYAWHKVHVQEMGL